jgi:UDP-N-acetylmuramyl pentapeptide synthase
MIFSDSRELKDFLGGSCELNFFYPSEISAVGFDARTCSKLSREGVKLVVPKGVKTFFDGRKGVGVASEDVEDEYVYLVDKEFDTSLVEGKRIVVVNSVFDEVVKISNAKSEGESGKLIAITGTVGKTSTKRVIGEVLKEFGKVGFSAGNVTYPILKKVFLSSGYDYRVFEVSAYALNSTGNIVRPDVAVLTSVGEGHSEKYGDVYDIFKIKTRVLSNIRPGGVAVVNSDIPFFPEVAGKLSDTVSIVTYGEANGADYRLDSYDSRTGSIRATLQGRTVSFNTSLSGRHNAINMLGALAVFDALGMDVESCLEKLNNITPPRGRGDEFLAKLPKAEIRIINDCYNANPVSMKSSLESFSQRHVASGRKVLVLGDMMELGEGSISHHVALSEIVNSSGFDKVFLVGENMAHLWPQLSPQIRGASFTSYKQVFSVLRRELEDGDNVLFKSSNSVGLNKVVRFLLRKYGA